MRFVSIVVLQIFKFVQGKTAGLPSFTDNSRLIPAVCKAVRSAKVCTPPLATILTLGTV